MYFITTKRMLEVCFSAHPNIQYRTLFIFFFMGPFLALDYFINGFSSREASKIPFSYVNLRMP